MKSTILLLLAIVVSAGCTMWNADSGKLFTMADNKTVDVTAKNGARLYLDSNMHSPIWAAGGTAVAKDLSMAGAAAVPWSPLGRAGATVAVPAITAFVNRTTARVTPTPAPSPKATPAAKGTPASGPTQIKATSALLSHHFSS